MWDYITAMLKEIRINKKPTIRVKKDNSKKTDYFINCRSCKQYIRGDFRSNSDNRYCQDCL